MLFLENRKAKFGLIFSSLFISLFATLFLWGFIDLGLNALGINAMIFGFLILWFFVYWEKSHLTKKSLLWLIPIGLMVLSLGLYTNNFTKAITVFLLPLTLFLFSTHEVHKNIRKTLWSRLMLTELFSAFARYLGGIFASLKLFSRAKENKAALSTQKHLMLQVGLGILVFLILAGTIFIPLLSSADQGFGAIFEGFLSKIYNFFESIFTTEGFGRIVLTLAFTLLFLGAAFYWHSKPEEEHAVKSNAGLGFIFIVLFIPFILASLFNSAFLAIALLVGAVYWIYRILSPAKNTEVKEKKDLSVMVGVVLGGVILLYLLFIGLQIKTLFVSDLPINFAETENLVKAGFWQLFGLTLINIAFYIGIYGKTTKTVQNILGGFTFASLLLVVSATQRIFLYVSQYGLSYEKFYAFYTVIFCIGIFGWFLYLLMRKGEKVNILQPLFFASLWMYSLTTILPLEKIIFSTNYRLTQQTGSRVDINELKMLSYDALIGVEKDFEEVIDQAEIDRKEKNNRMNYILNYDKSNPLNEVEGNWKYWREYQLELKNDKAWYERTLSELIYPIER